MNLYLLKGLMILVSFKLYIIDYIKYCIKFNNYIETLIKNYTKTKNCLIITHIKTI